MILEKIDEKRLLIALSSKDMDLLDLTFKQLSWKNAYSRQVIKKILTRAETEIGFFVDNNQLMIEAIPQNSGCFVLVTLLSKKKLGRKIFKIKEEIKPYLFEFKSSEDLLCAIERLYNNHKIKLKNTVFEYDKTYYILINSKGYISLDLQTIITEYGNLIGKDGVTTSKIVELGNLIAKDDAIDVIGKHLVG
ncbi:MAG: Adapter protein MecA [Eubacteriales bacterium SKADARSKE-1]|nr:Adapter protein MecA [Eubacteriales bacterium SKADARSKE-1]